MIDYCLCCGEEVELDDDTPEDYAAVICAECADMMDYPESEDE
jgi:hypothetical protein